MLPLVHSRKAARIARLLVGAEASKVHMSVRPMQRARRRAWTKLPGEPAGTNPAGSLPMTSHLTSAHRGVEIRPRSCQSASFPQLMHVTQIAYVNCGVRKAIKIALASTHAGYAKTFRRARQALETRIARGRRKSWRREEFDTDRHRNCRGHAHRHQLPGLAIHLEDHHVVGGLITRDQE